MKQIITWIGIILIVFILFIVGSFVFLNYTNPTQEPMEAAVAQGNEKAIQTRLKAIQAESDSLKKVIKNLRNELFFKEITADSLREQCALREDVVAGYKVEIEDLSTQLNAFNNRQVRVKELAKTYETLKAEEISPILSAVDDATIIAIYQNMSSRTRKNIIKALPGPRAAAITQQLAGTAS